MDCTLAMTASIDMTSGILTGWMPALTTFAAAGPPIARTNIKVQPVKASTFGVILSSPSTLCAPDSSDTPSNM